MCQKGEGLQIYDPTIMSFLVLFNLGHIFNEISVSSSRIRYSYMEMERNGRGFLLRAG